MTEHLLPVRFHPEERVTTLPNGCIFVFGSNPLGINGNTITRTGGAALVAQEKFGVKQGEKMNNRLSDSGIVLSLRSSIKEL